MIAIVCLLGGCFIGSYIGVILRLKNIDDKIASIEDKIEEINPTVS